VLTLLSWHRLSRRLSGWLLAALLLATLAPAVSRALAAGPPQDGQDWVEICSAQGMQWVLASGVNRDAAAEPDTERPGAPDLCGHCTLAAERFAPLLPSWPVLAAVVASWPTPPFLTADLRSAAAPRAAARGPPLQG
jgi:Protein of unknown function (DUF2946)